MSEDLYSLLANAADEGFADFANWCAKNWTVSEKDRACSLNVKTGEPDSEEFMRGWNACAEGISLAWKCYTEENK